MSATFNEISARLSSKNPLVIMAKNINISNYYYIENNFDNLNSYSLYICKLSNLPKDFSPDKITNLLIIIDINDEYDLFQLKNCNILMLEQDKINLYKLLEDLQDVINVKANIIASSNSIISAISKNENINTLIDIIYDYLKNPIIIANAANYLCAYNTGDNKINDSIWQNYIINNYPDPNYLDKIYYDIKFLQSISKENNPHIIDYLDIMEHRILLCPIKINNLNMAYLYILEANKPFNRDDIKLVNTVKKLLLPTIINDSRFSYCNNCQLDSIFYYLLSSDDVKPYFLEKTCDILNLDLHSNFFLININFVDKDTTSNNLKNLYDLIKSLFYNQLVFIYRKQICVLYITQDKKYPKNSKIESEHFLELCKRYNLVVGISDIFFNLHNTKLAYEQTLKAIDFSNDSDSKNPIFYYSDFMLTNLVYSFLTNKNTNNIVDLNFIEFLNSASQEYVQTLKAFINNNGNIKKAADELHIHYNTLKYRLNKINDLYDMNLDNLNYIIRLKLSYIALEFISNT
ncbi:MAG: helix-turn-helix domain-containing protein [Intestinibacter sp.]|uniref:PucR family transcriptional regulator n=1 Tax=Intestinibacter sp. TaxID=1965304 RepID=UPI0025C5F308|nr:helix-turn-helix domain-containing protein [Intestinibacter sp.]MCI6737937.1 helix-turn-helix domain-containing protein [Intestinibacter sp.]